MTGTKTNERPGTRAQVRYLRMSASKARVVLNLIRDKHVGEASQILAFSDRLAAKEILKVLRSAVANAAHNDEIPAEELYVSACYADEGPTLKRFRPRARGRAGRIHKQTCHITIVVSRLTDDELDHLRDRAANKGQADAGASRAARVAKSRGEEVEEAEEVATDEVEETVEEATEVTESEAVETEAVASETVDAEDAAPTSDDDEAPAETAEDDGAETAEDDGAETAADEATAEDDGAETAEDGDEA